MTAEVEKHFQQRLDGLVKSFRDMCEDQIIQYAKNVATIELREELTITDIDRAMLAMGMAIASEITERRDNVIATNIA